MRPTRRGWVVLAVVAVAVVIGATTSERSLNAVAAPLLAAVVAGGVVLWRAETPTVTYRPVAPGQPGTERTVTIDLDGTGITRVSQRLPDGVGGAAIDETVGLPGRIERQVTLERRGVHRLDGATVSHRDPLGLVAKRATVDASAEIVVHPTVHPLEETSLASIFAVDSTSERGGFDRVREYTPGDPLRSVHWKSSAKRDELFVIEFDSNREQQTIEIVGETDAGDGDEKRTTDRMAEAVATLAIGAREAGYEVGVTIPGERIAPGSTRDRLLDQLARADPGTVGASERARADVLIIADEDGARLQLSASERKFEAVAAAAGDGRQEGEL